MTPDAATSARHNAPSLLALAEAADIDRCCFNARLAREALARFKTEGVPSTRDEAWHYTNLKSLANLDYQIPKQENDHGWAEGEQERLAFGSDWGALLVFHDGHLQANLSCCDSLPDGVRIESLSETGDDITPIPHSGPTAFSDLNLLLATDAMVLTIDAGVQLEAPIQFLYISSKGEGSEHTILSNRLVVRGGKGSSATILENHTGPDGAIYLSNSVTDCHLAEGAKLSICRLQRESETAHHVGRIQACQQAQSELSIFSVGTGASLSRLDVSVSQDGPNATTHLNGLFIGREDQHMDHHIEVNHCRVNGVSHQTYRGILSDKSTGVFNGRVHVVRDAQGVDAKQSNRNLLLSRNATINAKPELEVYADDVKCAHGTTIGELDADQLFYLQSRGLPIAEARDILTFAFAEDIVQRIPLKRVGERLTNFMSSRFSKVRNVEELA